MLHLIQSALILQFSFPIEWISHCNFYAFFGLERANVLVSNCWELELWFTVANDFLVIALNILAVKIWTLQVICFENLIDQHFTFGV